MTRMARVSLVAWVLVSVILIEGGAFAKSAHNLRRIVKFRGIDLTVPAGLATARSVVKGSESSEIHRLWLVISPMSSTACHGSITTAARWSRWSYEPRLLDR